MGLSLGIVGLPNVGKSTLFNALTKKIQAEASNYPFTTIEPNVGVVTVPDPRIGVLAGIVSPQKTVPNTVEFVDIAGLVAGAHKGEGLGNRFLANIRETDAIAMVVRCFEDANVTHVSGKIKPAEDIRTILLELILADQQTLEKLLARERKAAKSDKVAAERTELLERFAAAFDREHLAASVGLSAEEEALLGPLPLITRKPIVLVANVNESEAGRPGQNVFYQEVEQYAQEQSFEMPVIALSAKIESDVAALTDKEQTEYLETLGLEEPGLDRLIREGYALLHLKTFFTAGPQEVRAWAVPESATAVQAAGSIHGDFADQFIRAEVIAYEDFVTNQGEKGAAEAGRLRLEGKDYLVQDGDVLHIRHGA